jgi:hypothetical protein
MPYGICVCIGNFASRDRDRMKRSTDMPGLRFGEYGPSSYRDSRKVRSERADRPLCALLRQSQDCAGIDAATK